MKRQAIKKKELDQIFNSLLPELRSDLERLDHRIRTIWYEATVCGVPKKLLEQEIPKRFWDLAKEIGKGA